jgi:HEPN domain-containing protein/predicted nucleotidyltransferase
VIAAPQPPIDEIVRTIVDAIHPRRVVLFGSRARGDANRASDVDVMVELDTEPDLHARERGLKTLLGSLSWTVDVRVYTASGFAAGMDDPGSLVYDIAREGKVLYTRDGVEAAPRSVVHERAGPPPSLRAWIRAAELDLHDVETVLAWDAYVAWELVCFHSQQAAEKYLKALIVQRWMHPQRTHNLAALIVDCRAEGYDLPNLDAECALLSPFAVTPRYPDSKEPFAPPPDPPTPVEGQAVLAASRRIIDAAKKHLLPLP